MRSLIPFSISMLAAGIVLCSATQAAAQSAKIPAQDCLGSMHNDTCEMTRDQYDIYARNRDWNANVKRNEEYDALRHQQNAEAKAHYNQRSVTGASAVMRRRRAEAESSSK